MTEPYSMDLRERLDEWVVNKSSPYGTITRRATRIRYRTISAVGALTTFGNVEQISAFHRSDSQSGVPDNGHAWERTLSCMRLGQNGTGTADRGYMPSSKLGSR
jgi:hypothetical protein